MRACTRRVGNQEQMLHATSRRRGGRAGHSYEMTSRHSHTPAQECWENKLSGREGGPGDGRHGMKKDCHFIRPVVMGFRKDANELLWLVFTEESCVCMCWEGKQIHTRMNTQGEMGETWPILLAENFINGR